MKYFGASDIGLLRKMNQDSYAIVENEQQEVLAVVCDGIGGGPAGEVASRMAVEHLQACFLKQTAFGDDQEVNRWLKQTIQEANDLIFMQSANSLDQKGMGTTCVGVLKTRKDTYIFNIGDSRIYGIYADDFICLTEDHSLVCDLLKAGEISEEEAKTHPNRNMLTNALGIWNNVKIDINKIRSDYQTLLICSDGLHGYVDEKDIIEVLQSKESLASQVAKLIDLSKLAGGYDNVSVILLTKEVGDAHE